MRYRVDMSFVHRRAGVLLSAIVSSLLVGCGDNNEPIHGGGGDDDDDGAGAMSDAAGGGAPDGGSGVKPDANSDDQDAGGKADAGDLDGGGDEDAGEPDGGDRDGGAAPDAGIDAGTPDAGDLDGATPDAGEPDAGPDELDGEFLLAIAANLAPASPIRFITTVDFTPTGGSAGTADFTFQPIIAENCAAGMGGLPVGAAFTSPGIEIAADGTFQIALSNVTLPAEANTILCAELTADLIEVSGTMRGPDLTCGDVTVTSGTLQLLGTFGAIRIAPGTIGDDLPDPVAACP